jgi:uncharacterized surface protein with fasciclin (FAS1) repeats
LEQESLPESRLPISPIADYQLFEAPRGRVSEGLALGVRIKRFNHLARGSGRLVCGPGEDQTITNEPMKTKDLTRLALLFAIAPLAPVAMAQEEKETTKKTTVVETKVAAAEPGTIADAINDSATFSILSKALKAADLEMTLGTKGSYTIFAPTDEAFMKLKEGTLDRLFLPENKEKLRSLLLYHVIPGQFTSSDLKDGLLTTSNGEKIEVDVEIGGIQVEDTKVAKTDLILTNGVMHSVGRVFVPKSLDGFADLDEH